MTQFAQKYLQNNIKGASESVIFSLEQGSAARTTAWTQELERRRNKAENRSVYTIHEESWPQHKLLLGLRARN